MTASDDRESGSDGKPLMIDASRGRFYAMLLLFVGVVVAYGGLFAGQFTTWDDDVWIERNTALSPPSLGGLGEKWADAWDGKGVFQNLYTPVTHTLWHVAARFAWTEGVPVGREPEGQAGSAGGAVVGGGRLDPVYFKTLSLAVHLLAAAGVYALLRGFLPGVGRAGGEWAALAGTAVFALHPMQVESVAWVSGLKDVLWTALAVWTLVLLRSAVAAGGTAAGKSGGVGWRLAGVWLLTLLALLTKPTAVMLPAMMAVVAWAVVLRPGTGFGRGADLIRRRRAAVLGVGVSAVLAIPVGLMTSQWQTAPLVDGVPVWQRPLVAMDALGHYVWKAVVPTGYALDYARSPAWVADGGNWVFHASVLAAAVVGLGVWRNRLAWTGAALAVLAVFPVLGFKAFDFATFSVVSDHYAYPLMVGVAVVVAAGVAGGVPVGAMAVGAMGGSGHGRTRGIAIAAAVVAGVLGVQTYRQVGVWKDSPTLYQHSLEVVPRSAMVNSNFAAWLQTTARRLPGSDWTGMMQASLTHARRAIQTFPKYPQANYLAGIAEAFLGNPEVALRHYAVAAPYFARYADFQAKLGDVYAELGRLDESAKHYTEALRIDPDNATAKRMLPRILAAQKHADTRPSTRPG